ncbi:hypothetical protein EW146_g1130 [Bondarzewia mesenterica]|uniref:Uncharacterized protein n=1 Tax=Bondarzewia mesenterica TaxID=1095465 RepID=A0A4V3XG73_9AGAM|nr:hypothetical protein EW146_g1130 [Bondarzewia mesenterica]
MRWLGNDHREGNLRSSRYSYVCYGADELLAANALGPLPPNWCCDMGDIPLDEAELLALFFETFFFALFLSLFGVTVVVLYQSSTTSRSQRRVLLSISTIMLCLAAAHLVIDLVRAVDAFIWDGAIKYNRRLAHPLQLAKTSIYAAQTILGDVVMVWRCYIVFDKSKWILVIFGPFIAAPFAVAIVGVWLFTRYPPGSSIFVTGPAWITTWLVLTMVTNMSSTVAIAYRIFSTSREINVQRSVLPIAGIIIQSGSLYALSVLVLLITYLSGSNGQYVALDICTPIVGIAFILVILQIRFRDSLSSRLDETGADGLSAFDGRFFTVFGSRRGVDVRAADSYGTNSYPMQVAIMRERQIFDGIVMPKLHGQQENGGGSDSFEQKDRVINMGVENESHYSDLHEV